MPLLCPDGFNTCTTTLAARERFRKNNTDVSDEVAAPRTHVDYNMFHDIGSIARILLFDLGQ